MKLLIKLFFSLFIVQLLPSCSQAQETSSLNLGFENINNETKLPIGFDFIGNEYSLSADSITKYSGKYSIKINSAIEPSKGSFGSAMLSIPAGFASAQEIELSGYVKTHNVTNGQARFWLRIDGPDGIIAFDNLEHKGLDGSTDWTKLSIKLNLSPKDKVISFGCLLDGKGVAWFDNLSVNIDGSPIYYRAKGAEVVALKKDHEAFDDSKIRLQALSEKQKDNLFVLCRIWGFLKYHHTNVKEGKFDWDSELIKKIPLYVNAESKEEINNITKQWLYDLGEMKNCKDCSKDNSYIRSQEYDFSWIRKVGFLEETIKKLEYIRDNAANEPNRYVATSQAGNPIFQNEPRYDLNRFPNQGLQLLSLFRLWNYVEYFYPYKSIMDKDMKALFFDNIDKFVDARDTIEYHRSILNILSQLNDSHAITYNNPVINNIKGNFFSIARLKFIQNKFIVTTFYNDSLSRSSNLKKGDEIISVNGKLISEIIDEKKQFIPASNINTFYRDLAFDLLRGEKNELNVEVKRGKENLKLVVKLFGYETLNKPEAFSPTSLHHVSYKLLNPKIGYINLEKIKKTEVPTAFELFKNTQGLIIDNRGYPTDFPLFEIGNYLVCNPQNFAKISSTNVNMPGDFYLAYTSKLPGSGNLCYKGRVAILMDINSQSSSEYHTMAFRKATNSIVIGESSAGTDGNVSDFHLPGDIFSRFTGLGIYDEMGRPTQRVGLKPDIEVKTSILGVLNNKDEILEKALEILK